MLARSFRSSSAKPSPSTTHHDRTEQSQMRKIRREKSGSDTRMETNQHVPATPSTKARRRSSLEKPLTALRHSEPVTIPTLRSVSRSSSTTIRSADVSPSSRSRTRAERHRADALPPSVAALLAVTAIPPRRSHTVRPSIRRKSGAISGNDLVQEWKQEAAARPLVGSHQSMDLLLEEISGNSSVGSECSLSQQDRPPQSRSSSSDSLPSLDPDERSILSLDNPPTPEQFRAAAYSSPGSSTKKKTKARAPAVYDTSLDHPLIRSQIPDPELNAIDSMSNLQLDGKPHRNPSRSNLTAALKAIKSKALLSLSQFSRSTIANTHALTPGYAFSDAVLWQHPFLFPRIGPEIRPEPFDGLPNESQRRYLNPSPLNFEEQQGDYCVALHSPSRFDSDDAEYAPMIKMQTYAARSSSSSSSTKKRRPVRTSTTTSTPDPNTEAGRALAASGPPLARQREPRENSDFLRVIVLEMNMRRKGKLEESIPGRATIWLPPRRVGGSACSSRSEEGVPRRWVGVSAGDV